MKLFQVIILVGGVLATASAKPKNHTNHKHVSLDPPPSIVNGKYASEGQFPYQAYLEMYYQSTGDTSYYMCGGALIRDDVILTAAHCMYDQNGQIVDNMVKAFMGSTRRQGGTLNYGAEVVVHGGYDPHAAPKDDIALVRLYQKYAVDGTNIATIPMTPTGIRYPAGTTETIAGYGSTTRGGGPTSDNLMYADVPERTNATCTNTFGSAYNGQTMLCAGGSGQSACTGDSGGPLTYNHMVYGVVSYGASSCDTTVPSVFTSVPYYNKWVNDVITYSGW